MNIHTLITRGKQRLRLVNERVYIFSHKLYVLCIKPYSTDEDVARKEFILNIILFGTLCFMGALECFVLYNYFDPDVVINHGAPYVFTGLCIFFLTLYILSRKNYSSIVAYIFVTTYTLAITYAAFSWGPDLYQVILGYAFSIVMAGILISSSFSFILTVFISIAVISFSHFNNIHLITFKRDWRADTLKLHDTIELALTYLMICFIAWLSNREIIRSLHRAHRSEKALREKNESLEIIVEERTKALRTAQAEKVSHLYRFAEFGRLSSGIFHDLMNPLSVVAMNMERLEENSSLSNIRDIKQSVDQAVRASRRMGDFIMTARKQLSVSSTKEYFSLDHEIRSALILLKHKAVTAHVTISYTMRQDSHTYGNVSKFSQIVTNLVSNAIDACDQDTIPRSRKTVRITLEKQKSHAHITFWDTGCGISPTLLEKIFDPFFTTKSEYKGMGLGLSTTKAAIEKDFDGTLTVKSDEGRGSTFTCSFPLLEVPLLPNIHLRNHDSTHESTTTNTDTTTSDRASNQ